MSKSGVCRMYGMFFMSSFRESQPNLYHTGKKERKKFWCHKVVGVSLSLSLSIYNLSFSLKFELRCGSSIFLTFSAPSIPMPCHHFSTQLMNLPYTSCYSSLGQCHVGWFSDTPLLMWILISIQIQHFD